jgi:predicted aspartyl protease
MSNASETAGLSPEAILPFKLHRGHMIVVKCSVGGLRDLTAIIDTGASETVLDIALVRKLHLTAEPDSATFISQQAKVWAVSIPGLELGPIRADHLPGIAADLSSLTSELGIRPQVVIGMDVLHRSSFLIDYQSRRLVFFQLPQGPVPHLSHSAALVSLASASSEGSDDARRFAVIEALVAGKTVRLQVDSGFEGLLLYADRVQGVTSAGQDSHIANLGKSLMAHSVVPPDVHIGDWHARQAQLTLIDGPSSGSPVFDGLIGAAFLSKKKVAFDFQNGMICWE